MDKLYKFKNGELRLTDTFAEIGEHEIPFNKLETVAYRQAVFGVNGELRLKPSGEDEERLYFSRNINKHTRQIAAWIARSANTKLTLIKTGKSKWYLAAIPAAIAVAALVIFAFLYINNGTKPAKDGTDGFASDDSNYFASEESGSFKPEEVDPSMTERINLSEAWGSGYFIDGDYFVYIGDDWVPELAEKINSANRFFAETFSDEGEFIVSSDNMTKVLVAAALYAEAHGALEAAEAAGAAVDSLNEYVGKKLDDTLFALKSYLSL